MSEKRSGPGKGRGSRFRPEASGAPPPPPKELVEDLLKEGDGDDGKTKDTFTKTASELKAALQNVTVGSSTNLSSKRLNPSAREFTPSSLTSAPLNPNSTEFTPRDLLLPSKQLPPSTSSSLNPNCQEFVPGGKTLNVTASAFVPKVGLPTSLQNGDLGIGADELDNEDIKAIIPSNDELPVLETQDIVSRFTRIVDVKESDQEGCDQLLKATAEMLLKATMYPGSFDRLKLNIATTIEKWPPADSTLQNLAEMIVYWGISEPALRYIACRAAQEVSTVIDDTVRFKKPLFQRLQSWYNVWKTEYQNEPLTEDRKFHFINLSLFYAEVFVRVRVGDIPFTKLVSVIVEFIEKLLQLNEETTITCACHILKLTGNYLEQTDSSAMEKLIKELKSLPSNSSLSNKTIDLVKRVVQLQEKNWDKLGVATSSSQLSTVQPVTTKLNTDAPAFVPSGEIEFDYQQPVRNAEEWKEYFVEDDDDDIIDQPDFAIVVDDEEGLDPEIELEMEAFIDEIEEHLMMQDFDPELEYNQQ